MSLFKRIVKAVFNEIDKPESHAKGEAFEQYVRDCIFPKEKFIKLSQTHSYNTDKDDYTESSLEPDFELECKKSGKSFFIECKYRSNYYDNAIEWCKKYQLNRYKDINRDIPVFIAIGVGNTPDEPYDLYVIPVKHIKYTNLFKAFLSDYRIMLDEPMTTNQLWRLL
tara:strand:- start:46 stop:546 length:501 start_codon:yes stop_codon:yes gene_type:complete